MNVVLFPGGDHTGGWRGMSNGSCGSNLDWGGENWGDLGNNGALIGDDGGESCGGADIEWRDFL